MIDNKTSNFGLALPDPANNLSDDVLRIISALTTIDGLIKTLGSSYSIHANQAAFPLAGNASVMYIAQDVKSIFIWTGAAYQEISALPASSDAVPEGDNNKYFTNTRARSAISATGSLSYNPVTGVLSFTANYALNIYQRSGASASVTIQTGLLPVKNRAGTTVNISITQ